MTDPNYDEWVDAYLNGDMSREELVEKIGAEQVDEVDSLRDALNFDEDWDLEEG